MDSQTSLRRVNHQEKVSLNFKDLIINRESITQTKTENLIKIEEIINLIIRKKSWNYYLFMLYTKN